LRGLERYELVAVYPLLKPFVQSVSLRAAQALGLLGMIHCQTGRKAGGKSGGWRLIAEERRGVQKSEVMSCAEVLPGGKGLPPKAAVLQKVTHLVGGLLSPEHRRVQSRQGDVITFTAQARARLMD
jgi:hypothetical protein